MPTYKNISNAAVQIGGVIVRPGETKAVAAYASPKFSGDVAVLDSEPKVGGAIVAEAEVTDSSYDVPYSDGLVIVTVRAISDVTFTLADSSVEVKLNTGGSYQTSAGKWDYIGKITVTGTAYVTTEKVGV